MIPVRYGSAAGLGRAASKRASAFAAAVLYLLLVAKAAYAARAGQAGLKEMTDGDHQSG